MAEVARPPGELGELMREAGFHSRDLPPPGEPFPGWELVAPMLRPRLASVFSLLERPIVLWDEPEQVRGAAERFWKRLEQIERSPAYDPDRIYFRWEDLERQAGGGPQDGPQGTRHRLAPGGQLPYRHAALPGFSRQHAGGHRRGPHVGRVGQSRGVLRFFYR
jgi:hypothetical protein